MTTSTPVCPYCRNTGYHLCPDVVEPVLIKCSNKKCLEAQTDGWRKPGEIISLTQGKPLSHEQISKKMSNYGFRKSNISNYLTSISKYPGYVFQEFMATDENIRRANFNIPKHNRQYYIDRDSSVGIIIRAWGFYDKGNI